jgi:hypothetical protein
LQKVMAKLCDLEDESDEDELFSSDEEDEDELDDVRAEMTKCHIFEPDDAVAMTVKTKERLFKIDSGCRGAHVLSKDSILIDEIDTSKWRRKPLVHGISGEGIETTRAGRLGQLDGIALVAPEADSDLLSLMELVKSCNGSFSGDKNKLVIKNGDGEVLLSARNFGDDFWSVSEKELSQTVYAHLAETAVHDQFHTFGVQDENPGPYLTAEQRSRAKEAHELCGKLRHPGDDTIIRALDSNMFTNCHLTSQDFRNGRLLLGPCLACEEAKMVAPTERTSTSPPATRIGQHVHADMILLEKKSIGGNSIIIVAKDEVSGYTMGIPSKDKSEKSLKDVGEWIIAEMNQYGHKVECITTDDERCFHTWTKHLAQFGVPVSHTPAGLHEKRAERAIRTVGEHTEAMKAALPYELPGELACEAYMDAICWLNRVPNKDTAANNQSPYQLVTGQKAFLPTHTFGETGLFYNKRRDGRRSEWGIFVGYGNNESYLRCYNPLTRQVTSKRKFNPQQAYPTAWNFPPRLRPRTQVKQRPDITTAVQSAPTTSQGVSVPAAITQGRVQSTTTTETAVTRQEGGVSTRTRSSTTRATINSPTNDQEGDGHQKNDGHQEGADEGEVDGANTIRDEIETGATTMHDQATSANAHETSTNESVKTDPELIQIKLEQLHEIMASKPKLVKEIMASKPQISKDFTQDQPTGTRTRRNNTGSWKDGPARFKALSLKALCSKASSYPDWILANKTSLKRALQQKGRKESVQKSIDAEIDNLEQPGVLKATKYKDIPKEARKDIINAYMFHKEKFKADGSFDKDKCRIVLLSNQRDPNTIGDSHSPTVNPTSVMTQLNLACTAKGTLIAAYDIKGAFLLTPVDQGVELYLRIGPELTEFWCARYPSRIDYIHEDGCLYFKLERYVYGLHEAPNKFNGFLDGHLKKIGFTPSRADKCFYIKETEEGKIMLSDHVDDMLATFPSVKWRDWFEEEMKPFELVKQYDEVSYLGIQIKRESNGDITLSQKGYIQAMLKRHGLDKLKKTPNRPATEKMTQEVPDGIPVSQKEYLSLVMGLMYAARFTRPDIAFPVGYLATKCSKPTETDLANAKRVLKYLGATVEEKMRFKTRVPFKPKIYADASHHLYDTGHGQAGMIITNGSAPVCHRSAKLKMITRSSSESELCSLEDASTYAIWYKSLLEDMGVVTGPIEILQDNKSTIIMATQGLNFRHNKHIMARKFFIQERIESSEVALKYCKTSEMIADILTKVVDKTTMNRLKHAMCIGK